MRSKALILGTLLLGLALPALAFDRVPAGVDYWQTLAGGATAYNFESHPIPAGFFCAGSPAFKGRITFEGVPLRTEPAGILGTTDTVIQRLDDAVFDANGRAETRIRGRALSLRGTEVLKTSCGQFKVTANLTDDQPVSRMVLYRENEFGGTFDAQLRLRVQIHFTNLRTGRTSSVVHDVNLPTVNRIPFAVGVQAQACLNVATTTTTTTSSVTLADGRPLIDPRGLTNASGKVVVGNYEASPTGPRTPTTPTSDPFVTGCYCQNGVCLPTYSWHDPCANNPRCEEHWTSTPCELGYRSQCASDTTIRNYADQLRDLHERGYISENPEAVLQKQLRNASQVERDQAAQDRAAQARARQQQ